MSSPSDNKPRVLGTRGRHGYTVKVIINISIGMYDNTHRPWRILTVRRFRCFEISLDL